MVYKKKRKNDFMGPLLRDWYGKNRGEAEMLRYTPETRMIAEPLEKIVKRLVPAWEQKLMQIQENWKDIAGEENARRCTPAFLNNGVFYIEVSHPAYRIALETPQIKNQIQQRIQAVIGAELCRSIKFIPGGRSLPRPGNGRG